MSLLCKQQEQIAMNMESEISIYNDVANYLAEWNPIGVPEGIAECEYSSYVPKIVELLHDKHALESYMQRVIDGMGVFAADVVVPESVIVTRDLVALGNVRHSHDVYFHISIDKTKTSWFVHYNDEDNMVRRAVEVNQEGDVVSVYSHGDNHAMWGTPNLTMQDIAERFVLNSYITKAEFDTCKLSV